MLQESVQERDIQDVVTGWLQSQLVVEFYEDDSYSLITSQEKKRIKLVKLYVLWKCFKKTKHATAVFE